MDGIKNTFKQLLGFYGSLSPIRKAALVFLSVMLLTVFIVMGMWAGESEFMVLWSGVDVSEAQGIINSLKSDNVPYRTEDNGTSILVPRARVAELRMKLTGAGITSGGKIIGFEIFDKNALGTTSYVQKINFRRALEGELTKSVLSISGVEKARVHLAIPDTRTFLVDQKQPTASVVIKLAPGKVLGENNVRGIGNLVASAVEGLEPEYVVILDQKGNLISTNENDQVARASNEQSRYRRKLENELEKRVATILGRVVGHENVEVRISAEVDFTRERYVQEQYDPEGAVLLSQVTMNEKFQGSKANPSGIPGSRTNLPGSQNTVEQRGTAHTSDRNTETLNYNISKKTVNTEKPGAQVRKLAAAVLVNSEPVIGETGKVESYKKRSDLKELGVLARNAIGFNEQRGDVFSIESLPFRVESFEEADGFLKEFMRNRLIKDVVWFGLVGTTILMFFFFVIRPFLNWIIDRSGEAEELPASVEEIESGAAIATLKDKTLVQMEEQFNPEKAESEALIEKIRMMVSKNPAKAVGALRPWITSESVK